jgi:hypothetical protein
MRPKRESRHENPRIRRAAIAAAHLLGAAELTQRKALTLNARHRRRRRATHKNKADSVTAAGDDGADLTALGRVAGTFRRFRSGVGVRARAAGIG